MYGLVVPLYCAVVFACLFVVMVLVCLFVILHLHLHTFCTLLFNQCPLLLFTLWCQMTYLPMLVLLFTYHPVIVYLTHTPPADPVPHEGPRGEDEPGGDLWRYRLHHDQHQQQGVW